MGLRKRANDILSNASSSSGSSSSGLSPLKYKIKIFIHLQKRRVKRQ
ncbi:MAG: hypothetical protein ACJ73C_02670 [Nitrososphaeraceae archaeon]